MATALPLPTKITSDSVRNTKFKVISASFGDGYEQVAPKGLNNSYSEYTVEWAPLTSTEKDTVLSVLDTVGAAGILTWTPCLETTQKKFRMSPEGYSLKWLGKSNVYSISCNLKQVFDVG